VTLVCCFAWLAALAVSASTLGAAAHVFAAQAATTWIIVFRTVHGAAVPNIAIQLVALASVPIAELLPYPGACAALLAAPIVGTIGMYTRLRCE